MKYIAGAGITAVSVIVRAKGEHEHHICTNKNCISTAAGGPWTPLFKQIFKDADMNLEDAVNKVHVPGHKGPHPREYHEYVFDKLKDALSGIKPHTPEYRTALENTLNKIRQEAVTPGTQVNNWLTKGRG
nr:AHH domain-containing protein [Phyllobacterium endophyticum]